LTVMQEPLVYVLSCKALAKLIGQVTPVSNQQRPLGFVRGLCEAAFAIFTVENLTQNRMLTE